MYINNNNYKIMVVLNLQPRSECMYCTYRYLSKESPFAPSLFGNCHDLGSRGDDLQITVEI